MILGIFLLSSETITLATLNWEPFFGETLKEQGVFAAISREAFRRTGYELDIAFIPWKRALEDAKQGYYDGLMGAYLNREREQDFYFTDPIMKTEEVFISKKYSQISFHNLEDLKQYSLGLIRGFSYTSELIASGFNVEDVTDDITNLRKLYAGRIDLIIIERHRFLLLINSDDEIKEMKESFRILTPPYRIFDLYCTISRLRKNGEEIVRGFNRALREMKADGTYNRILENFNLLSDFSQSESSKGSEE